MDMTFSCYIKRIKHNNYININNGVRMSWWIKGEVLK